MSAIFGYFGMGQGNVDRPAARGAHRGQSPSVLSRIGNVMAAPFYAAQETAQNTLDPRISGKKQEVLAQNREHVAPYNSAIKTLITENSSSTQINKALEVARRTLRLAESRDVEDIEKVENLQKLITGLEGQLELKTQLEEMRSGNYMAAGAVQLARNVTTGAYMAATAHSQADAALTEFSESFSVDHLLAEASGAPSAPENLYQFLVDGKGPVIEAIAAPILEEIQTEVSWLTDEKAYEVILHTVISSIQGFVNGQLESDEVKATYMHLQTAAKPLSLLKKKKALMNELNLLSTHYLPSQEVKAKKAIVEKELKALNAKIAKELPEYAQLTLEDALSSAKDAFAIAQAEYLTALTGEQDYSKHLNDAKAGALNSATKLLLRDSSSQAPHVIKQIKALIESIIFYIVRFVVKDLLNGNIDEGVVQGLADTAESHMQAQLQDHTFGSYVKDEQKELLPTALGAQIKALIPHLLNEVPQRLAKFKEEARDLNQTELDEYIDQHFRHEVVEQETAETEYNIFTTQEVTIESRIKNLSETLVNELAQGERLGLNIRGASAAVAAVRPLIRSKLPSGPSATALSTVGVEVNRWVGDAPRSNMQD